MLALHEVLGGNVRVDDRCAIAPARACHLVDKLIFLIALISLHEGKPFSRLSARQNIVHVDMTCFLRDWKLCAVGIIRHAEFKLERIQVCSALYG